MMLKAVALPLAFIVYIFLYLYICTWKTCVNTDKSSYVFYVPGNEGKFLWKTS